MRVSVCVRCGAGVGFKNATLCCKCRAADREKLLRGVCRSCGEFLRLDTATGLCVRCSRTCADCGNVLRFKTSLRCRPCLLAAAANASKVPCAGCGRVRFIRAGNTVCGFCSRAPSPPLVPRACSVCGELRRKQGEGMCHRCWTRNPSRPITQADNLRESLEHPPVWLSGFAVFATERHCVARACVMITAVGRLLRDSEPNQPQALLERARRPGRSAGSLARTLEDFFVSEHLAFGLDQDERLAAGRRQRRINATPQPLRPTVQAFEEHLIRGRERARRAGTRPRTDSTIEQALTIVRDLARFVVTERSKYDWSTVEVADIEAFLCPSPKNRRRRLQSSRQFFRWARKNRMVLVDPTRDLPSMPRCRFTGQTLDLAGQRQLFRRWTTDPDAHPHEALVGTAARGVERRDPQPSR